MSLLRSLGLLGWGVCIATVVAISFFGAIYGKDSAEQQIIWFFGFNVAGYAVVFASMYLHEVWLVPGRLLERDLIRKIAREYAVKINQRFGEGGRLIEKLKLDGFSDQTRKEFDNWVEQTRSDIRATLPLFEPLFDDTELGGLGSILDVSRNHSWQKKSPTEAARDDLIEAISRRRINLNKIYEALLLKTVSGQAGQ